MCKSAEWSSKPHHTRGYTGNANHCCSTGARWWSGSVKIVVLAQKREAIVRVLT